MQVHTCDSDVDWDTCDVRSCCQRSCNHVDCTAVGQVNSTLAHYNPIAGDTCFGQPGETHAAEFPKSVNVTTLHTCDVQKCCSRGPSDSHSNESGIHIMPVGESG